MSDNVYITDVLSTLALACDMAGGQAAWAGPRGISPAYLSDVLAGRRSPGPKILDEMGLRAVTIYVRKNEASQ